MQQVNMSGDKFHYRVCTTVTGYQGHGSGNASIWKIEDKVDYRVHVDDLNNIKADHKKWANAMGKQFLDEMKNNQGGKTVDTYYK